MKLQSSFIEITRQHECSSVNLLYIFRTPFHKNTSGGLLLDYLSFQGFLWILLCCLKPCCKLSFNGFLPSTASCWNQCKSLMRHYNRNAHNVPFCIFSCRTLSNFCTLSVIIVICNQKQNK